jgi:hypothetical protein
MVHPSLRINGVKPTPMTIADRKEVALLPFVPIIGLELETHFILLAMLEDAEPVDVDILYARLPGVDQEVASLILDRLERTGWVHPYMGHQDADTGVRPGPRFYGLTPAGGVSAVDLLMPLKERFFGALAQLLDFKLNEIFPESDTDEGRDRPEGRAEHLG